MVNEESTEPEPSEDPRYAGFPPGFFDRVDTSSDHNFYSEPRIVTHIDTDAIAAVGALYEELKLGGRILDVMSSWVSHFVDTPDDLVALGRNAFELEENRQATSWVQHDLNLNPNFLSKMPASTASSAVCRSITWFALSRCSMKSIDV